MYCKSFKNKPKKGILFSLAHLAAKTFPSIPRLPNPPGTKIPSADFKVSQDSLYLSGTV